MRRERQTLVWTVQVTEGPWSVYRPASEGDIRTLQIVLSSADASWSEEQLEASSADSCGSKIAVSFKSRKASLTCVACAGNSSAGIHCGIDCHHQQHRCWLHYSLVSLTGPHIYKSFGLHNRTC